MSTLLASNEAPGFAASAASGERLRVDIQALRGLAILVVVLQHAGMLPLKAGYLGVDMFFVVSGYLITGIIQRSIQAGTFTFTAFYVQRAKRLLPAAYVTFAVTVALSALFLNRSEMRDFTWQLLGAVTFTGNIALWMQTGYFEGAAHLKPLLHVWSLSIEEQYYALAPAALVFTPPRFWRAGAVILVAGSLVLCLALVPVKPGASFYLLPTRAWELGLGSLGILALEGSAAGAWLARLFWPALAAVLALPFLPTGGPHPGVDALIVCMATLIVILRRHPLLDRTLPARSLARLGDISYSLYLVHWPLLAFAANTWVAPVPPAARVALIALAVALAWALHRWVEQPARRATFRVSGATSTATLATSSLLVLAGFAAYHMQSWGGGGDYDRVRRANHGLSASCEYSDTFSLKPECRTTDSPRLLVWGDSYAMHLVGGIAATTDVGVVQATKTTCGPLLGASVFRTHDSYNRDWALGCLRFSRSVMAYLAATDSVEVVVLSSELEQYLIGNRLLVAPDAAATRGFTAPPVETEGSESIAAVHLLRTIEAIRSLGKRVVLVAPSPASGFDVGRCLERKALGKVHFGADTQACEILQDSYRARRAGALALLKRVAREADVPVVYPHELLCQSGRCVVESAGTFLYRDAGHFSVDGARLLAQQLNLGRELVAVAR